MDESGPRLVHGGIERFSHLETVSYRNRNWCADVRRVQSAHVGCLSRHFFGNRGTGHECIKIQRGSSEAKTRPECSDGAVTEGAAKVSYAIQKTGYPIF